MQPFRWQWLDSVLVAVVVALAAMLATYRLGSRALLGDEAIYANVGRQAAVHGHWYPLVGRHGTYFLNKQPFALWPVALSFRLLGVNEAADRLPSALCAVAVAALVYVFAAWLLNRWTAFLAAALLASCRPWLFQHGARDGVADSLLTLLVAGGLLLYLRFHSTGRRRWLLAAGVCAAATGLIKGALGPAMLLAITMLWELLRRVAPPPVAGPGDAVAADASPPPARARAAVVVAAPVALGCMGMTGYLAWCADMARRHVGLAHRTYEDIVVRATVGLSPYHVHDAWYYPAVLREAFGHWWIGLLPAGLVLAGLWHAGGARARAMLMVVVWPLVVLGGMSLSVSTLNWYLYPAMPAIAIVLAAGWSELARRLARWPPARAALICAVAVLLGLRVTYAWRTLAESVHVSQMQRFVQAVRQMPGARLYVDMAPGNVIREWNAFYLSLLEDSWKPVPPARAPGGCDLVYTYRMPEIAARPGFAHAVLIPVEHLAPKEDDLYIMDFCGGEMAHRLQAASPKAVTGIAGPRIGG
jgi:4-amino-4-deoxy-L-arabinose transferase-like glycosyltransferase